MTDKSQLLSDYDVPVAFPKGTLTRHELEFLKHLTQQLASLVLGSLEECENFASQSEYSIKYDKKDRPKSFKITTKGLFNLPADAEAVDKKGRAVEPSSDPEQITVHMEIELEPIEDDETDG